MSTLSQARLKISLQAVETLANPAADGVNVNLDELDQGTRTLNSSSTPAATKHHAETITIAGTQTVDLTSLSDVEGTAIDGTGLKVQAVRMIADADNAAAITVAPGASNPYPLFGTSNEVDLAAGAEICHYSPEGLPDVAAAVKEIDISGTNDDILYIQLILG